MLLNFDINTSRLKKENKSSKKVLRYCSIYDIMLILNKTVLI